MPKLAFLSVFLLLCHYAQSESRTSIRFQECVKKCTSTDTRDRIKCKIGCSEEMKKDYVREMEDDSRRSREEEGIEVKKCSNQCPSPEEDPINGVERQVAEEEVYMDNEEYHTVTNLDSEQFSSFKEEL